MGVVINYWAELEMKTKNQDKCTRLPTVTQKVTALSKSCSEIVSALQKECFLVWETTLFFVRFSGWLRRTCSNDWIFQMQRCQSCLEERGPENSATLQICPRLWDALNFYLDFLAYLLWDLWFCRYTYCTNGFGGYLQHGSSGSTVTFK